MILSLFKGSNAVVKLPATFNMNTMRPFIGEAVEAQRESQSKAITFDFSNLRFIEPEGVVVLCNTIEYFRAVRVKVSFSNHNQNTDGNRYLDDSGFFKHYLKGYIFASSGRRSTTMPLELFQASAYVPYLYGNLMPWISREVHLSSDTLETIKTCLEEVFHNIEYHSGITSGCTFSQHFPKKNRICIAISDFGIGIPTRVRTQRPDLNDADAIRLACEEGFTTKSNVRNRGAGLPNLIRYVVQRNSGTVLIHSGAGYLSASRGPKTPNITSRTMDWSYPGTLVHVVLRTDTLEKLESDIEPEVFQW